MTWKYGYDPADQLIAAVKHATDTGETVLKRYAYAYDPAGNRTVEQIDDAVTLSAYDHLNRLTSQAPGGPLVIAGSLNEPGTVTISGVAATVDAGNNFRGTVPTTSGTNTFTIVAKDASGNTTTQQYEIELAGSSKTFTYDANGNLTADGIRTFEWDARNQVVAAERGSQRTEFLLDGQQRLARTIEKENGISQLETWAVWCDSKICEERAANGETVVSRAMTLGEHAQGAARFYTTDHLASVTEVTSSASSLLTRYAYDAWGRRSVSFGSTNTSVGFTGHRWQEVSSMYLTRYRGYDPEMGRWISEDPIGITDGPNVFAYAHNSPTILVDLYGLQAAQAIPIITKICELLGRLAIGMMAVASSTQPQCKDDDCNILRKGCKPCEPPVGTVAHRADTDPRSRPHRGVPPPHWKLYVMMQSPYPACKCFWSPVPDNRGGFGPGSPPPGVPPITPAKGGGPQ